MSAKETRMHGLENVDKMDDADTPAPPVMEQRQPPAEVLSPPPPETVQPIPIKAEAEITSPTTQMPPPENHVQSFAPSPPLEAKTELARTTAPSLTETRAHLLLPADFREHKYRVPRTFRFDVDLLEYIERHEKYRAALEDPRTFTEKINDWVRTIMDTENPVLLQAEADVMGLRNARNSRIPSEVTPQRVAETQETPETTERVQEPTPPKNTTPPAPQAPPKKEKSVWKVAAGSKLPGSPSS